MKRDISYLLLLTLLFLVQLIWIGCDEDTPIPSPIQDIHKDTTYVDEIQTPQQRIVLLEEYTGVYCYTCPATHQVVAEILSLYPDRVISTNTHSTSFGIYSNPDVMGNLYDFRTVDGDSVVNMLGGVISLPSGVVNRKTHSGETTIISQNRDLWQSYVEQELTETVKVNIEIETDFTKDTRNLQVVVTLNYTQAVNEANYLSVLFVESNILDKQLMADLSEDPNYSHQHITRDYLTSFKGDEVATTKVP
ncbi:MAG: Omp28-related outer membrane protein, partial [Flavobacteriales bacterium]|nr:Omp28-related outer membrane protein [Flavobacteriales bacterium]